MRKKINNLVILGGGIAAISLAYFLQNKSHIRKITIIEKERKIGGLLRSFKHNNIFYDVGPHIIFSKHIKTLKIIKDILKDYNTLERFNKIILNNNFIEYPIENNLYQMKKNDLNLAFKHFMNNPYEDFDPKNMLQFFLKTFGEGITNLYLAPYNQKIWKFDPSFLDLQMVSRIPKPPVNDIVNSAKGISSTGYKHQKFFYYPKSGGIETLLKAFKNKLNKKVEIFTNFNIDQIDKSSNKWVIKTNRKVVTADKIVSTIPLDNLTKIYSNKNAKIKSYGEELKYNSICIGIFTVSKDYSGNNFAFTIPDKDVIFHRISKLDFLGTNYMHNNGCTYLLEITYNPKTSFNIKKDQILEKCINGLKRIKFIKSKKEILSHTFKSFSHAYVVYDLNHKKNTNFLKNFFKNESILLHGRFGSYKYLNSDQVIHNSILLSKKI